MAVQVQPNIGDDLLGIHQVVSRALNVALQASQAFIDHGVPDASTRLGLVTYVRSLASVQDGHHRAEDWIVFPSLREHLPDAPYDVLAEDHSRMVPFFPVVQTALARLEDDERIPASLRTLHGALVRLKEIWDPHIEREERHLGISTLARLLSPDEHVRLAAALADFNRRNIGPDYLVLPFILYNLSEEWRAVMARALPPHVTERLVPVVWRARWSPMMPFLLVHEH